MVLYLDICCLKRPFDDQAQPRIRIEAEAVLGLLAPLATTEAEPLRARTAELMENGLHGFDALHLACAEAAGEVL